MRLQRSAWDGTRALPTGMQRTRKSGETGEDAFSLRYVGRLMLQWTTQSFYYHRPFVRTLRTGKNLAHAVQVLLP